MIQEVQEWVNEHKLPTIDIDVAAGEVKYFPLIGVVYYSSNYRVNQIRANVRMALYQMMSYDDREIGDGLRLSIIYNAIQSADGVSYVNLSSPTGDIAVNNDQFLLLNMDNVTLTYTEFT